MKPKAILKIAVAGAAFLAAAPAFAQGTNLKFSQNSRNGVCYFSVQGPNAPGTDKPMTFELSYRVRDGNMGVGVLVNGWPKAQAADPEAKHPVTVIFDSGKTIASRSGGYASGFNDRVWGGWGAENSAPVFALTKNAKTARVEVDGMKLGPFDLQMKGLAYTSLDDCAKRVRAGGQ
ncbi:hypothetical protein P1X14_04550 [Sphingomonas sp. AOB5]|uniref:hypothetical protein n=1 Tax=Sphingomonas sp. AOB5 TaxID=3034017 RepID=UPI0023F9E798|nr:hypothetical protein [Sphingomonas sp. AOB5]MDF7774506.1 hypothetical protein [Sphingomonas sp. AOB5]